MKQLVLNIWHSHTHDIFKENEFHIYTHTKQEHSESKILQMYYIFMYVYTCI